MGLVNLFTYFATMMGIYGILALSLNFQYGHAGLVNFGVVGFFATGAYVSALATLAGSPFFVGIMLAGMAGGIGAIFRAPLGYLCGATVFS